MAKEIAVVGTILTPTGIITDRGLVTIVSLPSEKVKAVGNFAYRDPLMFTVTGASAIGYIPGSVFTQVPQEIRASTTKVFENGVKLMRREDMSVCDMMGIPLGQTAAVPFTEPWMIDDPAQDRSLGN